ncbi:MAG: iron ABC transporter permease [Planctomycetota bacterium]
MLLIVVAAFGVMLASALRLLVSNVDGGLILAWPGDPTILSIRLWSAIASGLVGGSLAASGVLLQSVMRNPLAGPSLLGMTAGAALGVAIATYITFLYSGTIVMHRAPVVAAVIGALASLGIVVLLASWRGGLDPVSVVLIGLVISVLCGALILLVQHLLPDGGLAFAQRWTMGSITQERAWGLAAGVGGLLVVSLVFGMWLGPSLDAASMSDDEARSVGVELGRLRLACLLIAGLLTAGSVALAGPIGFVGLICPHIARSIAGPSHRTLIVLSTLLGVSMLVLGESLVAAIRLPGGRLPVGVVMALVGGPAFLILLRKGFASGFDSWGRA